MVLGIIDVPGVDDLGDAAVDGFNAAKDWASDRLDDLGHLASDFGDLFVDGVVSFGDSVSQGTGDLLEHIEDLPGEIVEIGGRVIKIIDDGFEGIREDITDAAEGIAWLAEHEAEAAVDLAEDVGEAAIDTAVDVAETAIDVGMWTWEAANYVQDQASQFGEDLVDFGGAVAGEALHPMLDPILGENTVDDLIDAGVDFGRIYATGGEAGVRDFVNQQVAAEAGHAERAMVTEVLGERAGVDAGVVTQYGLLRAQGMDPMHAAQAVGIDPTSEVADIVETGTAELIGQDGAEAAGNFARDLMTTYGQQASDAANRTGLEQYGDRFDPNTTAAITPHTVGWTATSAQIDQLNQSGSALVGEGAEAFFEPIVGQDAAEAIGEYGPRIGMEVVRAVASGGLSGGELALAGGRTAFHAATGEEFETFVGDRISTEFADTLGPEGSELLGRVTESGLRLGLNYAAGHAGENAGPDQQVTDIDLDDLKDAMLDLGADQFEQLTGINPETANRLLIHMNNDNWDAQDTDDLLASTRQFVPEDVRDYYDAMNSLRHDDTNGAINSLIPHTPQIVQDAWTSQQAGDGVLRNVLGYDPNGGSTFLDQAGISQDDLNDALNADEVARGVDAYVPSGNPPFQVPTEAQGVFQSLTQGLDIDPNDPAAPLVTHAVALQDTIQMLQATGGPGAQPAIAQAQALMVDLGHQVDLLHDTGPVIPTAATELAAQQEMMQAASSSLQALAGQGGAAAAAAQQAQAMIGQAQQAFVTNAGDPEALVAAQQQALGAAMAIVQSAAVGAPFAQAQAINGFAQQTTSFLAQAQAHTATAHGVAPPPEPPPEATQEGSLEAQQDALTQASQVINQMLPVAGLSAGAAQQAQALIAQAQAVTGDDPDVVVATQQQLLSSAAGVLQAAAAQSFLPGGDPGAGALGQQAVGLISQANGYTAMAHGVTPAPPDPYAIIANQNAAMQASLAGVIAQNAINNPQAVQAAQQALGALGAHQAQLTSIQQELLQAQAADATTDDLAEVTGQAQARAQLDDRAIAAARAQAGLDDDRAADTQRIAHEPDDPRLGDTAQVHAHATPSFDAALQDAMVAQQQAVNQALLQMMGQGGPVAAAAQQAQAALAETQTHVTTALAGQGVAPDVALAAQQQALANAMNTINASAAGNPMAAATTAPAMAQLQALAAQTSQASQQVHEQIAAQYGDDDGQITQAELHTAMAAQHQAVDLALQNMMSQGPQAAMAASQAQAVLAGAQSQIQQLAAQGPDSLSPEQAVGIQMAAMQQAAGLVAQSGPAGAAPNQLLASLMSQTGQALAMQQQATLAPPVVPDLTDPGALPGNARPARPGDPVVPTHDRPGDTDGPGRIQDPVAVPTHDRPGDTDGPGRIQDPVAVPTHDRPGDTDGPGRIQDPVAVPTHDRPGDTDGPGRTEDPVAVPTHDRPGDTDGPGRIQDPVAVPTHDRPGDTDGPGRIQDPVAVPTHDRPGDTDGNGRTESALDDGFDDDIMAGHLDPNGDRITAIDEAQQSSVLDRLDQDGDGQIDNGIVGPQATADDPMGDMDWQDSAGDALTGTAPTAAATGRGPSEVAPMEPGQGAGADAGPEQPIIQGNEQPDWQDAPGDPEPADQGADDALPAGDGPDDGPDDAPEPPPAPPEPAPMPEPEPAPMPEPEPAPVPEPEPSYEAPPEPDPEPVTHDDGDYFN